MATEKRLIEIPSDGIVRIPIMRGLDTVGERHVDLSSFPTVDAVEVKHGRWENLGGRTKMDLRCSVCNNRASRFVGGYEDWWDIWKPAYCPNCGAKMDGGNEDEKPLR